MTNRFPLMCYEFHIETLQETNTLWAPDARTATEFHMKLKEDEDIIFYEITFREAKITDTFENTVSSYTKHKGN